MSSYIMDLRKIVGDKKIVAIETSDDAECIYDCELPSDIAFIVGNESRGIREDARKPSRWPRG